MKRNYQKPKMESIQVQQKIALLAGSPTDSISGVMQLEGFGEATVDPFAN